MTVACLPPTGSRATTGRPPFEPDPGHAGEGTGRATPPKSKSSNRLLRAEPLADARLLLVDSQVDRLRLHRGWIEREGGPEAETATLGDEALDILGANAQQFDIVALWPPLADDAAVDFIGVLRRCKSPVRLMVVTAFSPTEVARPGCYAGCAFVDDSGTPNGLLAALETVLAGDDSVAEIVANRRVPLPLKRGWAEVIYGTRPGSRFHAALD